MKKLFYILLLFCFSFSLISPKSASALTADQSSMQGLAENQGYYRVDGHNLSQIFTPSKNVLEAVNIYILGLNGIANITLNVWDSVWPGHLVVSQTKNIPATWSYELFDFDDISVTPGQQYYIVLQANSGQAQWRFINPGRYDGGYLLDSAIAHEDLDFGFATYGHNASANNPPANQIDDNTSRDTTSFPASTQGTGEEPTNNVSNNINPPSNLKASDVLGDHGNAIQLTWDKSTSSISGYKIFKSSKKDSGFTEIGRTASVAGGYIDKDAKTGTTYYYFVRAHNDSGESANSNIASAKSYDDIADILKDFNADKGLPMGATFIIWAIIILFFCVLFAVGLGLLIYFIMRKRQQK